MPARPLPPEPGLVVRRRLLVYDSYRSLNERACFGALPPGCRVSFTTALHVVRTG